MVFRIHDGMTAVKRRVSLGCSEQSFHTTDLTDDDSEPWSLPGQ